MNEENTYGLKLRYIVNENTMPRPNKGQDCSKQWKLYNKSKQYLKRAVMWFYKPLNMQNNPIKYVYPRMQILLTATII